MLASSAGPRASATAVTGAGMVLGTPEYMAPELIMGEPFDGRVDQYALAVTVYELLCGRRPFEDDTKTRVLVLHTSKAPPALTEWCPSLPERLSRSVLKGMAKDPSERYPSCAALAAAVAAAAAGTVARDDRVRLTCPACGTAGWLTAADLAKLKESGRRLTCSACKAPLDLSGARAEQAAPGTRSGGTKVFSPLDRPAEPALPREPGPDSGGTMALSARGGSGEHASPRARSPRPAARRPCPPRKVNSTSLPAAKRGPHLPGAGRKQ